MECFHQTGCDSIIAVGGGSSIDLAKAIAVSARHPGSLQNFALIEGGLNNITSAKVPIIALPTTAGTGSEVGRGAIIILDDGRKVGIISPYVIPKVALCDPTLTVGLPPGLTAATGMDAVAHCIETFLAPSFNPPAEGIALDGLRRHDVAEDAIDVAWVPGAFEIPFIAKKMAESGRYDAVICLGAVIRGATSHYDYAVSYTHLTPPTICSV